MEYDDKIEIGITWNIEGAVAEAETCQAGEPFWRALVSGN